jgi:tetratricopeptide (TPR) repeat protein
MTRTLDTTTLETRSTTRRRRAAPKRRAATALLAAALLLPAAAALAAGSDTPAPPPSSDSSKGKTKDGAQAPKRDDQSFLDGYRAAYVTVYQSNDYAKAITELKALGQDDRADVANLIGYSYRKLGDYRVAQIWYERALKADPAHVKTWQYYGLWQVEQGHRDRARAHLARIEQLCGASCPEYRSLAEALGAPAGAPRTY